MKKPHRTSITIECLDLVVLISAANPGEGGTPIPKGVGANILFGYIFLKTAWPKLGRGSACPKFLFVDPSLNSSVYFQGKC